MGLDTTHDCWHGSYGGFHDFRDLVGRAAKLPYRKQERAWYEDKESEILDIDWTKISGAQIAGKWPKTTPLEGPIVERQPGTYDPPLQDNVLYLLIHSDCDGDLHKWYLPRLKARLEELEPEYQRLTAGSDMKYYQHSLRRFINGLERAIQAGQRVRFH